VSTTNEWLQQYDVARVALVLVFDGVDLAYTTTEDTSGIATAYSSTDWTNFNPGLFMAGEVSQEIDWLDSQIDMSDMTFRVLDTDGDFVRNVIWNDGNGYKTRLTSTVTAGSTSSISVKSASSFSASGTIYIGHEAIAYTSKTGTSFGGTITRGKWNLHTTNSGAAWAPRHEVTDYDSTPNAPLVTQYPVNWYNRRLRLYIHHKEEGVWSTKANARVLWEGRMKDWLANEDGSFSIRCAGVQEELFTSVFRRPWQARVRPGTRIHAYNDKVRFGCHYDSAGSPYYIDFDLNNGDGITWGSLVANFNSVFATYKILGTIPATHIWSCGTYETDEGPKVYFRVQKSSGSFAGVVFYVIASKKVFTTLGFELGDRPMPYYGDVNGSQFGVVSAEAYYKPLDRWTCRAILNETYSTEREISAPLTPLIHSAISLRNGEERLLYQDEENEWQSQAYIDPDHGGDGSDGIVEASGLICSVYNVAASDYLRVDKFVRVGKAGKDITPNDRVTNDGNPLIRQIWSERDHAGQVLLRLLLSTGNTGYNHTTYDKIGYNVGAGLPASMFDINSFQELSGAFEIDLRDATDLREIIESALAANGCHMVFKDGKLSITPPGFEAGDAPTVELLTEDNKASPDDFATVEYSSSGMVNRVTLESSSSAVYKDGSATKLTVQSTASLSDYGQQKSIVVKATGVVDPSHFIDYVALPALKYFARPLATFSRTITFQMSHLVPGDVVKISDDRVIDSHTGTRGVTGVAAWLKRVSFNWDSGIGEIQGAYLPDHAVSKFGKWGPMALVTSISGGDTVLNCSTHRFSHTSDSADASKFVATDVVDIIEFSSTGAPESWASQVVQSRSGNAITLTAALSPAPTAGKYWVVKYADKSAVTSTQRAAAAYMANDSDTTGYATDDANLWAAGYKTGKAPSTWTVPMFDAGSTNLFVRPRSEFWAQGEPVSDGLAVVLGQNINNINNYKTRQCLFNQWRTTAATHNATTRKLIFGPILVPLNGVDRYMSGNALDSYKRKLFAQFRMKTSNASHANTIYITTTDALPTGTTTGLVYGCRTREYSVTSTSTSYEWKTLDGTIDPIVIQGTGQAFTYICVEMKNASTSTSSCEILSLWEGVFLYA
jgi:hypothetical protein